MSHIIPTNTENLLQQANDFLQTALNEYRRSESDAVTHLICMNSRKSIANYLMGYLFANGAQPDQPISLEKLMAQCIQLNPEFKEIDLSNIACRHQPGEEAYCLGHKAVDKCLEVAKEIKLVVEVSA